MTNINRKINFYTQAQRFAARVLFIVGLLVNCNPQRALASDISLPRMITTWAAVWAMFSGREVSPLQILANNSSFSPSCEEYLSQEDRQYLRRFMTLVASSEQPCLCINLEEYTNDYPPSLITEYSTDYSIRCNIESHIGWIMQQACTNDYGNDKIVFLYQNDRVIAIGNNYFSPASKECPYAQGPFSCPPQA